MKLRFRSLLFFLLIYIFPIVSEGMPPFEDLDDFFITLCKKNGKSFNPCLLPSRFQGNLNIIRNLRFLGNMGSYFNPECPPHRLSITTRTFPQSFIIATIQDWFPSPDGAILVPNQTGDTIGKLDPHRTGRLLKLIEAYLVSQSPSDEEAFKLSLYDLLMKSERPTLPTKYKKILAEYPEFCLHDFKSVFSRELYRNFEFLAEEQLALLKTENILHQDPLFLTKLLKFLYRDRNYPNFPLFENDFLKDGELETYRETLLSPPNPETHLAARLRYFKNKEKSFTTLRFVEVLIKSLNDQRQGQEHLPQSLVERTIFSFFWKKAKTPDDILNFLSGYLEVDPETLRPSFPRTVFSEKTYWTIRNDPEALKASLSHPEKAAFLSFGYQSFEDSLPPLIDYQVSLWKGLPFPNCIETVFERMCAIASKVKKEPPLRTFENTTADSESEPLGYFFKALFLPDDHPLNLFFAWLNENPESQLSQERCDRVAVLCSALSQVQYLKSSGGKETIKDCEVSPGLINLLNLFRVHFMTPLPAEPLSFDGGEDMIVKEFDALCHFLSRDNFKLTWTKDSLIAAPNKKEYFGTLTFFINDKEIFDLVMENGHGHIKYSSHIEEGWKQRVDVLTLKDTLSPEILYSFSNPERVGSLFESLSAQDQITFAYSLNLNSSKMKLSVIRASFTHNRLLIPFAKKLMDEVVEGDSPSSTRELLELLSTLITKGGSFLTNQDMLELFTKYPYLLSCSINDPLAPNQDQPNQPNNNMVLFALEHNKRDWLQSALPKLEYLQLDHFLNPDLLSEFFQEWLPKCSKLQKFYTHSKTDKDFVHLSAALPSLTHLLDINFLIFGSNSFIPNLPGSIKTCKIVPMGAYLYKVVNDQCITEINRDYLTALTSPLLLFFEQHPNATFELNLYSKISPDQKEIEGILNVSQFPKERFSLTYY